MKILYKDCDQEIAKDKTLPRNSYIVSYEDDGKLTFDIVQSESKVEIFDHYYDNYRNGIKSIEWTSGTVNPKTYGVKTKTKSKK